MIKWAGVVFPLPVGVSEESDHVVFVGFDVLLLESVEEGDFLAFWESSSDIEVELVVRVHRACVEHSEFDIFVELVPVF